MKLQDQCCTREQGQRLVELGVKQDSLFWWMPAMSGPHGEYVRYGWHGNTLGPAYNVAELGEMLPPFSYSWQGRNVTGKHFAAQTSKQEPNDDGIDFIMDKGYTGLGPTEAHARVILLIHLLEQNIITASEVNDRLASQKIQS